MKRMYFLISPNCNLKCKYCFQLGNEPEKAGSAGYHSQKHVRADETVVEGLVAYCLRNNVTHVEIFGGEPLFYRDMFEHAVTSLCERVPGMSIGVITNGTLITEKIMRMFETLPVSILLSLDGGRERHNELRGDSTASVAGSIASWSKAPYRWPSRRAKSRDCTRTSVTSGALDSRRST